MTSLNEMLWSGDGIARVQPGLVYDRLNDLMFDDGYFLPYHVSSSAFCTIGGNVSTRASGLRSIKYGTVDNSVKNVRMVTPDWGVIDTSGELPHEFESRLLEIRERLLSDGEAVRELDEKKDLKTSTGYNLQALLKYEDPSEMVAHLVVGSVGTLGVITEIELKLQPIPKRRVMVVTFFDSIVSAGRAVPDLRDLDPSLLELMDGFGTSIVRDDTEIEVPENAGATLLIEFDENIDESLERLYPIVSGHALHHHLLEEEKDQKRLYKLRWKMLIDIKRKNDTPDRKYLSFVDDLGVPIEEIPDFIEEIYKIFEEEGIEAVIYGHIGEGNLHIRPLIERENWRDVMKRVGGRCFSCAFDHGGTVAAEHGSGRNRLGLIEKEWGEAVFGYFKEIKDLFDSRDIMNPGILFSRGDITDNLEF
jgi:FAD/FMN-containing dehydrogenase